MFVGLVCCLLSSVVLIMYLCVLPTVLPTLSTPARCVHLLLAHWLLVHVVFNFKHAVCVPPGTPSWVGVSLDTTDSDEITIPDSFLTFSLFEVIVTKT